MYVWKNRTGNPTLPLRVPVGRLTYKNNTTGMRLNTGTVQISKGVYGTVNAFYNATGSNAYARKQSINTAADFGNEVRIMRKIHSIVPYAVPKITSSNTNKNVILQYIKGGDLTTWLNKTNILESDIYLIIIQVLTVLQKIAQKDPSFRHNDLHCGNILIDDDANTPPVNDTGVRIYLTDFGLARDSQIPCTTFEGPNRDEAFSETLKDDYGIYVGNHKMYDAVYFLSYLKTVTKSTTVKGVISSLLKRVKIDPQTRRPLPGFTFKHSYRTLISFFKGLVQKNNTPMNLSSLFKTPRKIAIPKPRAPPRKRILRGINSINFYSRPSGMKLNIKKWIFNPVAYSPKKIPSPPKRKTPSPPNNVKALMKLRSITKTNSTLYSMNLRRMFPRITNKQFKDIIGIVPRKDRKTTPKLNSFATPVKLKSKAIIGTSRFKNKTIKRASPKKLPPRAKVPSPAKFNFVESPFNSKKFNTSNLSTLRPVNIETYFQKKGKTQANAKSEIERIVISKRVEAWEKAQAMLKGQVKITRR